MKIYLNSHFGLNAFLGNFRSENFTNSTFFAFKELQTSEQDDFLFEMLPKFPCSSFIFGKMYKKYYLTVNP